MRRVLFWLVAISLPVAAGPANDLARAIRENALDRDACYRVRDLTLTKEEISVYLTDGYLMFGKPVAGRPVNAIFTTDVEGGDGEVLLRPPTLAERRSLASYTGSPILDEHFSSALFVFTGDQYQTLLAQMPKNPANKKVPEVGALMDERWSPTVRNFLASYDTRLVLDLLNAPGRKADFFSGIFRSAKNANFEVIYDPENPDQIAAGQFAQRNGLTFFDIWAHFPARSARNGRAPTPLHADLSAFRIQATVQPDLTLSAVTRVKVKIAADAIRAVPFNIAQEMKVGQVTVDGVPAEVLQRSDAAGPARGENALFLVAPGAPLRDGVEHEFEFHHEGKAILDAGNRTFYVTARSNWYPSLGSQFATYDLTFRYPRDLELVTPGEVVDDRTEGDWRITHRRPAVPIRVAGFNLGDYAHAVATRGNYVVDVCANRTLEPALQPRQVITAPAPTPPIGARRGRGVLLNDTVATVPVVVDPLARLAKLASGMSDTVEFLASKFGPPALSHLTVSPISGNFGQGYPGLIYLSTRSYVSPNDARLGRDETLFYDDVLQAHETAHQWWGAQVTGASYHDEWLMEALANYSAMLYLEKSHGRHEMEMLLDEYRSQLLAKRDNGEPVDSAGPIVLGTRLESSLEPRAWRTITYGKGSWILHMLRRRMGDERFFSFLAAILQRYRHAEISTEQFRLLAAEFLPPQSDDPKLETFFEQWVYSTGIPGLKLNYSVKGQAPSWRVVGTLAQTDVSEDFTALVPVEIQVARGKTVMRWVRASNEPVSFTVALSQQPLKVSLDPNNAVLRR